MRSKEAPIGRTRQVCTGGSLLNRLSPYQPLFCVTLLLMQSISKCILNLFFCTDYSRGDVAEAKVSSPIPRDRLLSPYCTQSQSRGSAHTRTHTRTHTHTHAHTHQQTRTHTDFQTHIRVISRTPLLGTETSQWISILWENTQKL